MPAPAGTLGIAIESAFGFSCLAVKTKGKNGLIFSMSATSTEGSAPRKVRLLAVDDNALFVKTLERFLKRHPDFEVVSVARGGEEGLAKAAELKPDVALIDLNMPGMSGLELIRRLKALEPRMGLVVLTLMSAHEYRDEAFRAGADDFVRKEDLTQSLAPAIRRVAARER